MSGDATGARRYSPSAERNGEPILAILERFLPASGSILEIASGTGQHAAFMAGRLPGHVWLPSEPDLALRQSIEAWAEASGASNLRAPRPLDVTADDWGIDDIATSLVAVFNANMIHISPWATCSGLMAGAGRYLPVAGRLFLYGPFLRDDAPTVASNARFDASLRAENPEWGLRALEAVVAEAADAGLALEACVDMPANNLSVVFKKLGG